MFYNYRSGFWRDIYNLLNNIALVIYHVSFPRNAIQLVILFMFQQTGPLRKLLVVHQFLICLYGRYVIRATTYKYMQIHWILHLGDLVLSKPRTNMTQLLVSNEMLAGIWARLCIRLSSMDASSSIPKSPTYMRTSMQASN